MLLITGGVLLLVSLFYQNAGPVMQWVSWGLRQAVGNAIWLFPLLLFFIGGMMLIKQQQVRVTATTLGGGLVFLTLLGLIHLSAPPGEEFAAPEQYGGYVGAVLASILRRWFGPVGSYIVLAAAAVTAVIVASETPLVGLLRTAWAKLAQAWGEFRRQFQEPKPDRSRLWAEARKRGPAEDRARRKEEGQAGAGKPRPESQGKVTDASDHLSDKAGDWPSSADLSLEEAYRRPDLDLIAPTHPQPVADREAEVAENAARLEEVLASFNVEAKVVAIERGPAITRYEIVLAPGIRVNKVVNLADDLALALAALDVRVEAPVPGKGVVGIEVPNKGMDYVYLVDILRSPEFQNSKSLLTFALGKDIAGHPMVGDLTRMPHLLIGGATNSGKSVCLNALIVSLLYKATPREVRFLMIDPKRVELTLYQGIPHLDRPVVTSAQDAADLLRGAIVEMDARYDRFAEAGVRDITSYNRRVPPQERMPYIVIVIDELADLMMQAAAEFEMCICRLAQLARATGIHLVIATQRPSVNVITGLIKANISSRIAFAVASQVDSRTIIDSVGAERLIGSGDMLYQPIDASKPTRIQGAFIDEDQVRKLVGYLKQMKQEIRVEYRPIVRPVSATDKEAPVIPGYEAEGDEDEDELFAEAVALVRAEGQASASRLQRRFSIGYNRAGRLIDLMEERGIIGPAEGSKPRRVLSPLPFGSDFETTRPEDKDDT